MIDLPVSGRASQQCGKSRSKMDAGAATHPNKIEKEAYKKR